MVSTAAEDNVVLSPTALLVCHCNVLMCWILRRL